MKTKDDFTRSYLGAMRKFKSSDFTPTKFDTAGQKAKWANHLVAFLEARCPLSMFHGWFYTRLSTTFMHIAHYNRLGFHEVWFCTAQNRARFVKHLLDYRVCGDPAYTYSDVEAAIQAHVRKSAIVERMVLDARDEKEAQDKLKAEVSLAALPPHVRRQVAEKALKSIGLA